MRTRDFSLTPLFLQKNLQWTARGETLWLSFQKVSQQTHKIWNYYSPELGILASAHMWKVIPCLVVSDAWCTTQDTEEQHIHSKLMEPSVRKPKPWLSAPPCVSSTAQPTDTPVPPSLPSVTTVLPGTLSHTALDQALTTHGGNNLHRNSSHTNTCTTHSLLASPLKWLS